MGSGLDSVHLEYLQKLAIQQKQSDILVSGIYLFHINTL